MSRGSRLVVDGLAAAPPGSCAPFSLAVGAGECVALLAADDDTRASALMDRLAGHGGTPAGRILVDGADITALPPVARQMGILSDRDPLFGHLSLRGNVALPLAARRVREPERTHRVQGALALLALEAQADLRPAALGPEATIRAALARVLVCDPVVLVLDDPLRALAAPQRRALHTLVRRLVRARALSLLLLTRDREEALIMGDRIGVLAGSALRQLGNAAELLDRPASEFVAVAFGEANRLSGQVEWVEDEVAGIRLSAGPRVEAMSAGDLAPASPCVVCVRPERIAVAFAREGAEWPAGADVLGGEALRATLSDLVHLGDHLRMRFRLASGGEVLVRRPASQPTAGLHADRPALLAWQAVHAVAFPLGDEIAAAAVCGAGRVR